MRDYNYSQAVPQKKVDVVSIIIAIIAVTLIVAGTYLLIQALKPSEKQISTVVRSSSSVSSLRSQVNNNLTSSTSMVNNSVSSLDSSSSLSSNENSSSSTSIAASTNSSMQASFSANSLVSNSSKPSSVNSVSGLATGSTNAEVLFRVDSVGDSLTKLTVLKTGFTNTRWLQPGAYINLENSLLPNATVGSNYVIPLTIGSSQTNFTLQSVGSPVKQ